jgi:hypothetical protein
MALYFWLRISNQVKTFSKLGDRRAIKAIAKDRVEDKNSFKNELSILRKIVLRSLIGRIIPIF